MSAAASGPSGHCSLCTAANAATTTTTNTNHPLMGYVGSNNTNNFACSSACYSQYRGCSDPTCRFNSCGTLNDCDEWYRTASRRLYPATPIRTHPLRIGMEGSISAGKSTACSQLKDQVFTVGG